tara:strand:+ start:3785 stop:4576 length:792 start_codon:yes stop_codon:yes gene_type:complete
MTNRPVNKGYGIKKFEIIDPEINIAINPFGENNPAERIYQRAEKLSIATYLVTNLVPHREEIRNTLRQQSRQLLPLVLAFQPGVSAAGVQATRELIMNVRHIVSLLDILHAAGHISPMNLEVLKEAYVNFAQLIELSEHKDGQGALEIEEGFFNPTPSQGQKKSNSQGHTLKDTIKDTIVIKDMKHKTRAKPKSLRTKRRLANRRMLILDVVTQKAPVHINDIVAEIPNSSPKTIQRELTSLIADGVIKKTGSKRWTAYSVVT